MQIKIFIIRQAYIHAIGICKINKQIHTNVVDIKKHTASHVQKLLEEI